MYVFFWKHCFTVLKTLSTMSEKNEKVDDKVVVSAFTAESLSTTQKAAALIIQTQTAVLPSTANTTPHLWIPNVMTRSLPFGVDAKNSFGLLSFSVTQKYVSAASTVNTATTEVLLRFAGACQHNYLMDSTGLVLSAFYGAGPTLWTLAFQPDTVDSNNNSKPVSWRIAHCFEDQDGTSHTLTLQKC